MSRGTAAGASRIFRARNVRRRRPGLYAGGELGFLAFETPDAWRDTPYFDQFLAARRKPGGWGNVTDAGLESLLAAECHADMYERLTTASPGLRAQPPGTRVLDKAPRYVCELDDVMRRAPGIPVVVIHKGPRSTLPPGARRAIDGEAFRRDVLVVSYERDLVEDAPSTMRRVYDHLGLGAAAWRDEFLNMTGSLAARGSFRTGRGDAVASRDIRGPAAECHARAPAESGGIAAAPCRVDIP